MIARAFFVAITLVVREATAQTCAACSTFEADAISEGVPIFTPVCGADGITYDNECDAAQCGDTIAVCAGACPCAAEMDPFSDACPSVSFSQTGHQHGPSGAYASIANVSWPADCCAECQMDAACSSYTWANSFYSDDVAATCFIFGNPINPHAAYEDIHQPSCFSGNKIPHDYLSGPDLPTYWVSLARDSGTDYHRLGFSVSQNMWYKDEMATCVGWGQFDEECDSDEFVCASATGSTFGFGVEQMEVLHELFHQQIDRHWQCPGCHYPQLSGETVACIGVGSPSYVPEGVPEEYSLALPGKVSPNNPGMWVDCDCHEHHMGEPLMHWTYWWETAIDAAVDPTRVTRYQSMWYYDGAWTCVGSGLSNDACNSADVVCAGASGALYGSGSQQMQALAIAVDAPGHKHPLCPV